MDDQYLDDNFNADIDLTPLIDVVFLLLLFFILAATFSQPVLQVALPSASTAAPAENDPSRLILSIDQSGELNYGGQAMAVEDIPGLLSTRPEGPVELRVDRAAPFDAFIGVMDKLRANGRADVLITAKPE